MEKTSSSESRPSCFENIFVDNAIHWITQLVSLIRFHWTVIYRVDNLTVHRLNNWGQMFKCYDSGRLITSRLVFIFKSEEKYCILR